MTSRFEGQPLPSIRSSHVCLTPLVLIISVSTLSTKRRATNQNLEPDGIRARVLRYLILEASIPPLAEIVKVIHSCIASYEKSCKLGQSFMDYFIRAFRKFQGQTPRTSSHSNRPSFDKDNEKVKTEIEQAHANWVTTKHAHEAGGGFTQCAHIVPTLHIFLPAMVTRKSIGPLKSCAKVAKLSGAAEHVDNLSRETESSTVLATDGGSSELLNYAIMKRMR
ncbi:hypothetical protein C8J55DRAFT_491360 [Lentinula edodes]|uniref:Uncharacterized protein n=1 Tax=Lentinula lateritia TaxID=40482 RepID=A0A9W9DJA0_9AGAR|nr:hypothetical protein C8J55DRAFT_491360 [Lentinula edodes]